MRARFHITVVTRDFHVSEKEIKRLDLRFKGTQRFSTVLCDHIKNIKITENVFSASHTFLLAVIQSRYALNCCLFVCLLFSLCGGHH